MSSHYTLVCRTSFKLDLHPNSTRTRPERRIFLTLFAAQWYSGPTFIFEPPPLGGCLRSGSRDEEVPSAKKIGRPRNAFVVGLKAKLLLSARVFAASRRSRIGLSGFLPRRLGGPPRPSHAEQSPLPRPPYVYP